MTRAEAEDFVADLEEAVVRYERAWTGSQRNARQELKEARERVIAALANGQGASE